MAHGGEATRGFGAETEIGGEHGDLMAARRESAGKRAHLHRGSALIEKRIIGLRDFEDAHADRNQPRDHLPA
jgi:hypothetical protein